MKKSRQKRKDKEESIVERLEKENRDLKSQIRSLSRQIKKLSKNQRVEELFNEVETNITDREDHNRCKECGKGYIVTIDLGPRKQKGCNTCLWRGKITKK